MRILLLCALVGTVLSIPLDSDKKNTTTTTTSTTTTTTEKPPKDKPKVVTADQLITKSNFASHRNAKNLPLVPPPVTIFSNPLPVKDPIKPSERNARKLVVVKDDTTHVEGTIQSDTVADKHIHWRNAKVINDKLVIVDDKGTIITSESDSNNVKVMRDGKVMDVNLLTDLEDSARAPRVMTKPLPKEVVVKSGPVGVDLSPKRKGAPDKENLNDDVKHIGSASSNAGTVVNPKKIVGSRAHTFSPKLETGFSPKLETGFQPIIANVDNFPDFYYKSYYDNEESKVVEEHHPTYIPTRDGRQQFIGESADGKPIYYVNDDSENNIKPQEQQQKQQSQQHQQYYQQQQQQQQHHVAAPLIPAKPNSFDIKEHSFQMGPGGPIVDVPIPIPKPHQSIDLYSHYKSDLHDKSSQSFAYTPYHQQYYQPESETILEKIGNRIKYGIEKIREFVSPVVDPIQEASEKIGINVMEAGEKISQNLGIAEKIDRLTEKAHDTSAGADENVIPIAAAGTAIGLLTFGLAYALVSATNSSVTLGKRSIESPIETVLSFFDNINIDSEKPSAEDRALFTDKITDNVRSFASSQNQLFSQLRQYGFEKLRKTPCAKRILCDTVSEWSEDTVKYLEKNIKRYFSLLESSELKEVIDAIHARDCYRFSCGSHSVDSSQVISSFDSGSPR